MHRFASLIILALLCSLSAWNGIAQTTRSEIPAPSAETISKLEEKARQGFAVTQVLQPFVAPPGTRAHSFHVIGGHVQWIATGPATGTPSGQTVFNTLNFRLSNSSAVLIRAALFNSASNAFPIFFELAPGKSYFADLPIGTYYVGVFSDFYGGYFMATVGQGSVDSGSWYYNIREYGFPPIGYSIPASAVRRPTSAAANDDIQQAVAKIRKGRNAPMPPAQATAADLGGKTEMVVENSTSYTLIVYFSGPQSQKLGIPPGGSQSVTVSPGNYEVAASVSNPSVIPFYGKHAFDANMQYSEQFYIQRR